MLYPFNYGSFNFYYSSFMNNVNDMFSRTRIKVLDFDTEMKTFKSLALFFVYISAAQSYFSLSILFSFPQCGQNIFFLGWNSSLDANDHHSLQKSQVKCQIVSLVNFIDTSFTFSSFALHLSHRSENYCLKYTFYHF